MNAQNTQRTVLLGAITFAVVCGWPFLGGGADTPPAPATPQEKSATPAVERAPSPQTTDEPPAQSTPSTGSGSEVGATTGEQEPASPATAPTMQEESVPPAEGTDIQERGIRPGLVTPGATLQIAPALAPTPSLTAIRNAIRVTSKSVSVNLRIPPNLLAVTVPVEVSVAYISPAQAQRRTKTYSRAAGLTILYREAEGDGKPRAMRLDITMRELVPNGKSFSFSMQFTIIPLYQADLSPLSFRLLSQCDTVGKSDITLRWSRVGGQIVEQKFDLGTGETKMVNLFTEGRREFSTTANLVEPTVQFDERDLSLGAPYNPIRTSATALVPGPTKEFSFGLAEGKTGPFESSIPKPGFTCFAHIKYTITRKVMTFDQFGAGAEGSQIR